jgi:leucyl-tRNA synthetase
MIDFKRIEKKWLARWERAKLFEADVDKKRKKFFTSVVIPYVNGDVHIGHSYTYTRTDAYARFKRMQGHNVLLAQGFHATGEPIVGAVERLKNNDQDQIGTFKLYGATDKDLEDFKEKGAKYVAKFWSKKMTKSLNSAGFSIDWRRTFTLSVDPCFSRFIEWQYNTLRKLGYVVQGTHPVVWCPKDQSPTGDHDRLRGEGESPIEYTLLKFDLDGRILPAATLRPETIYGVTNMWLEPNAEYVEITTNGEKWIVSREAVEKIRDQLKDVKDVRTIVVSDLFGKRCRNPVTNKIVPILPANFVDPSSATGVVMSVPSHAPYDFVALQEMIEKNELERFGIVREEVEPITLIKSELGDTPAKSVCKEMKIISTKEMDKLDSATALVYKKEFHTGVLNENCGPYEGSTVSGVKEKITIDLVEKNIADVFYDVKDVVCRCATKCHVKILENQWFLKYSDPEWKVLVRKCLEKMRIYPEEARNNFLATLEWMNDKACTRKGGLGTQLPWDKTWIIETLSDSTIYMAYYTIAHIVNKRNIKVSRLTDEVFDYIFLGKGTPTTIARKSGIRLPILKEMKSEFDYFYPMDFRNSAKELVQNHLLFYVYHHTAFWPESKWPRAIGVNGLVNVEGEKMSKSKGNIIPLKDAVSTYGADLVRINIAASSEAMDDGDWRAENIKGYRMRLEFLHDLAKSVKKAKITKNRPIDSYLLSRMQKMVRQATENYEVTRFRTATTYALFEATNEIKWYLNRVGGIKNANRKALADALSIVIRLIAPLTPFIAEELWSMLGNKKFVSVAEWPKYNSKLVNEEVELGENLVKDIIDDVREIQKIKTMRPEKVTIFVADDWEFQIYNIVLKNKGKPMNEITKKIMSGDLKRYGNATVVYIQGLYKKINEIRPILSKEKQFAVLNDAKQFLENEIKCPVVVIDAEQSQDKKAKQATPQKPGILLE